MINTIEQSKCCKEKHFLK